MDEHQPHEFLARVTRCADDSNFDCLVHFQLRIWNSGNQEANQRANFFNSEFPFLIS
jgi:hypothetical protein